jgi:hypothetical protein
MDTSPARRFPTGITYWLPGFTHINLDVRPAVGLSSKQKIFIDSRLNNLSPASDGAMPHRRQHR